MKKIIIIIIFINTIFSFTKENLSVENIFLLKDSNLVDYKIKPIIYNDTLYYVKNEFYNINDSIFIDFCCAEDSTQNFAFLIPNELKNKRLFIADLYVNDSLVIMLDLMNILIYKKNIPNIFKIIKLKNSYFYIYFYNNKIYCFNDISSSSNLKLKSRLYYSVYNLNGGKIFSKVFKELSGIDFTYFQPRKIIDIYKNNVLISNVSKYELYFSNTKNHCFDTIKRKPFNWVNIDDSLLKRYQINRNHPKKELFNYMKLMDKQSLIERIYFINNNKIFIAWSSPMQNTKKRTYYYDIWKKKSKKWVLMDTIIDDNPKNKEKLNINILKLGRKLYVIKNGYLISVETIPFILDKEDFNNNFLSFSNKINNFLLKNPLRYSILVRKFK